MAARVGARRRARRVERRLRAVVDQTVREQVVGPLEEQLAEFSRFAGALAELSR